MTRSLLRPRTTVVAALAGFLAVLAHPAPAAEPRKATRILDACVYDLYFQQRSSEDVTRRCRCVVRVAGDSISEREAASYRVGSRVTGSLRRKIYGALDRCP